MTATRLSAFVLFALLAGCQSTPENPVQSQRIQGQLFPSIDGWQILSCEQQEFPLNLVAQDPLTLALEQLTEKNLLQIDARIQADDSRHRVSKLYRLAPEGNLCQAKALRKLAISASGNEPFWQVRVSKQGLVLNRIDQAPVALPYLEEQLADGRIFISSHANDLTLGLWLAPGLCQDSMSGAISHLSATLTLDGQSYSGCAYVGSARD